MNTNIDVFKIDDDGQPLIRVEVHGKDEFGEEFFYCFILTQNEANEMVIKLNSPKAIKEK